jgi:hypothetical protein
VLGLRLTGGSLVIALAMLVERQSKSREGASTVLQGRRKDGAQMTTLMCIEIQCELRWRLCGHFELKLQLFSAKSCALRIKKS